ncbi:tRNA (guanine-N(7)-)-methyltransferase (tRNA(m7G46)-methyltransferase), partial [Coemansia erecta]
MAHVRKVVNLLVPLVLPPEQSSFAPHRVLVREMLTGALFAPIVLAMADPDTLNQLLDTQLGRLIREQHMVTELRDALDQQARTGDTGEGGVSPANVFKGSGDTILKQQQHDDNSDDDQDDEHYSPPVRSYEEFMTMIDECQSPASLQRIHEDILAQIRKRRILIMGQNKDDIVHGHKVRDVLVYINRLYVAKKKAERRLEMLVRDQALLSDTVPRRQPLLKPSPMSRTSTYYQHRDDPAKLGPPQFTQREILTNVSSLSAFAEYMDVIGHKFILEFWLNVEGVRQSSSNNSDNNSGGGGGLSGRPSRAIFPSIVRTLWKSYFTLRVDELASLSVRGYEVEAAISRVQRLLKPYRVVSAETVDLDVARLDDSVCVEAFELICLVQNAVFRHMETSILPPFVRSAFYSQFLKEYYVTPRQDLIEAALFEPVTINEP